MTDGNTYAISKHLDEREDYDALQEVTAELEQLEARIEELEAKLEGKAQDLTECAVCVYELEAKLAKAVEAAEKAVGHIERIPPRIATARVELCDAIAELKGKTDE